MYNYLQHVTIVLLLILSKTSVVITYYSICLYLFRGFYLNLLLYFIDFIQSIYNLNTPF